MGYLMRVFLRRYQTVYQGAQAYASEERQRHNDIVRPGAIAVKR